jgi:hypothetical protein
VRKSKLLASDGDFSDHSMGLSEDVPPGEAEQRPAGGDDSVLPYPVFVKCCWPVVHLATVCFDSESAAGPGEVEPREADTVAREQPKLQDLGRQSGPDK